MNTNENHQTNSPIPQTAGSTWLASCQKLLAQLESAKATIASEFRWRLEEHEHLLDLAMNEAEALAWETGLPQLFFPTLAMEKASAVATWHERQRLMRRDNWPLAFAA